MYLLGIETSCDETAVALVERTSEGPRHPTRVIGEAVSSQIALHHLFGGVVPEMATREHLRILPTLVPQVVRQAGLILAQVDAVAVTQGPGLASSLLIGHSFARGLGLALGKPVYGINHLEGHLFSPFLATGHPVQFPFVGLVVSGGHTLIVHVQGWDRYGKMGASVDDAAGEAFDKVARLFGLGYPGGPAIEGLAHGGNPDSFVLPRSFPERDNFNFSFSGLKTAVRLLIEKLDLPRYTPEEGQGMLRDLCASFQKAVIDVLVRKALAAMERTRAKTLVCSGGVLCNSSLRQALAYACQEKGFHLLVADRAFCTDNAVMIAGIAAEKLAAGLDPGLNEDIDPNLSLFASPGNGQLANRSRGMIKSKNRES